MMKIRFQYCYRLILLFVLICVVPNAAAIDQEPGRLALVIGNTAYSEKPLLNPANDARAMSHLLAGLGFEVQEVLELKADEIGGLIDSFVDGISPGDTVVVFYAGHGVQIRGKNYLIATDGSFHTQHDLIASSINVTSLLNRIDEKRAGIKVLLLDACRDNPYLPRTRSTSANRGLARVGDSAPSGTLIGFATRPGGVADDGDGDNGLYTSALLRHLDRPGLPVELMLKAVANTVVEQSNGAQEPWVEGGIRGDFSFVPKAPGSVTNVFSRAEDVKPDPIEAAAWQVAEATDSVDGYRDFLAEYPAGQLGPVARLRLAKLMRQSARGLSERDSLQQLRSNPDSAWDVRLRLGARQMTLTRFLRAKRSGAGQVYPVQCESARWRLSVSLRFNVQCRDRELGQLSVSGSPDLLIIDYQSDDGSRSVMLPLVLLN